MKTDRFGCAGGYTVLLTADDDPRHIAKTREKDWTGMTKNYISLDQETRDGYPVPAKMKEIWNVELDLLLQLDKVCRQLGIRYFLDAGTLLGAVRHRGFIPWDDDIDVIMLRKDYDVLVEKGSACFTGDYFFQCAYTDVDYPRGHAQLRKNGTCAMLPFEAKNVKFHQGIFIDIFVLDGLAPDKKSLEAQFAEKNSIMRKLRIIGCPGSSKPLNRIVKKPLRCGLKLLRVDFKKLFRQYDAVCRRYSQSEAVDRIMLINGTDQLLYFQRKWFAKAVPVVFEGYTFPAPIDYESVLTTYYGPDYMTPVKAPSMHGELILDAHRSYTDVLRDMK